MKKYILKFLNSENRASLNIILIIAALFVINTAQAEETKPIPPINSNAAAAVTTPTETSTTPITREKTKPLVGNPEDGKKALEVLKEVIAAYSAGDVSTLRQHLDFKMIGFQKLIDGAIEESNYCKQMRINLTDTQVQVAPDLVVIQTNWEKRCVIVTNMSPFLISGHSTFLMQGISNGVTITGISGSNPITQTLPPGGRDLIR